jgi:hypothetical protein
VTGKRPNPYTLTPPSLPTLDSSLPVFFDAARPSIYLTDELRFTAFFPDAKAISTRFHRGEKMREETNDHDGGGGNGIISSREQYRTDIKSSTGQNVRIIQAEAPEPWK